MLKYSGAFGLAAVVVLLLSLAFWLGLIGGTFWLIRYFFL